MQLPSWTKFGLNNRFEFARRSDGIVFIRDNLTDLMFRFTIGDNVNFLLLEEKSQRFFSLANTVNDLSKYFTDANFDYTEFNRVYDELAECLQGA